MATLNTAIRNAQIEESTITYDHLDAVNTPSGTYMVTWDETNNKFQWSEPGGISVNEIPSGSINGTNKTFTLSESPITDTEQVYLNGLLQKPGASNDYTISDTTITFIDAPQTDDIILVSYLTSQLFSFEAATASGGSSPTSGPYGYSMGGYDVANHLSTIDRIAFPFDSGTASHVGNLSLARQYMAGCNSSNYGYSMGGDATGPYYSTIDRIAFPFDSGTATHVGDLSVGRYYSTAGCNSSDYGYAMGGYVSSGIYFSTIDRIAFPFNSGTASHVGNLSGSRRLSTGCNSSNYGYSMGGHTNVGFTTIDRITFPFNSGIASHVGNLSLARGYMAGCNSSNYGYGMGGYNGTIYFSTIDRITFPFDSGTASHVGNLSASRIGPAGCNSSDYGYIMGGFSDSGRLSTVDRITFPFDSGTATDVGNLSGSRQNAAGCDGTDFVSLFV